MKKKNEKIVEKPEETKEQLMQSNQILGTQLRILEEEKDLENTGRYRRQHLVLLNEQNQILKGLGLALNRIGMDLEDSGEEEGEEEVADVELVDESNAEEEEPEETEGSEEPEEKPIEEEPEPLSKEEEKIQKKIDKMSAKLKKVKEKKK